MGAQRRQVVAVQIRLKALLGGKRGQRLEHRPLVAGDAGDPHRGDRVARERLGVERPERSGAAASASMRPARLPSH